AAPRALSRDDARQRAGGSRTDPIRPSQMRRFIEQPLWQRCYIAIVIALGAGIAAFVFCGPVPSEPARAAHPALLPILLVWMVLCSIVRLNLVIQGAMMTLGSAAVSLAQIQLGTREAMFV